MWRNKEDTPAECSKRPFNKAAASEEARRVRFGTLSPLSDARTPLAAFSSILFVLENTACP